MPGSGRTRPYTRVWEAFLAAPTTEDGRHDTAHWRAHAGRYAACVIRVPATQLLPGLERLRQELAPLPGVRLHPDYFLHIMLQELGFISDQPTEHDEISTARFEEFVQAAIEPISSTKPFYLDVDGTNAFLDAVFLEVVGDSVLPRLHARLFELAALPSTPDYPYLPHCTIAHFDGSTVAADAASVILPWRQHAFGRIDVSEIEIVTLDPRKAYPELESYAVIPLDG